MESKCTGALDRRYGVFAYLTAENAALYRAVMRAFMHSKERFVTHLRPQDLTQLLHETASRAEIDAALLQLCEWGNLQPTLDATDVRTAADFYKPRQIFEITVDGESAERAVALFEASPNFSPESQNSPLSDICFALQQLRDESRASEPDGRKIHRHLLVIRASFEDIKAAAQSLTRRLDVRTGVDPSDARQLIDEIESFISELVLALDSIGESVSEIEAAAIVPDRWRSFWELFRNWFQSQPERPSLAEVLRERARAGVPALLKIITNISDREIRRIDRSSDFRILARWFSDAESDAEAHRLWRLLFGLSAARHLMINDATLDDYEARAYSANTSWLTAPPLRISTTLRESGSESRTGRLSRIIDRSAEKERLAAATREEALRIMNAQHRFGTGRRMRLSDLEHLESSEFDLFLDILGEAMSARVFPDEAVEILSGDGCLRIKLEPTLDGREATIFTTEGAFSGPDHWISIEQLSSDVVLA